MITASAECTVAAEEIQGTIAGIFPATLYVSRRMLTPFLLIIFGNDTYFNLTSTLLFKPYIDNIMVPVSLGLGNLLFAFIIIEPTGNEEQLDILTSTWNGENRYFAVGNEPLHIIPLPIAQDESHVLY